ncbi:GNAT family N-acetyltransferase [Nocardia sp. BMG111209]|uniref:GNAT family N-acetyltransferase n=1 Tax=Nocardia sp. BMG111209 TaxID=1160137 RepID=UPI00037EA239|nr:GNAT family N-acetyltransferase [Nocardia sp. BMG111209]
MTSVPTDLTVLEVEWDHPDAVLLRGEMAAEVGPRYAGLMRELPVNPNHVDPDTVVRTYLAYADGPAGHAAVRWNGGDLELKRMFVRPRYRGSRTAAVLLEAAEHTARTLALPRLILQTGHLQPEAVRFYERNGYQRIPHFPPYEVLPLSHCFEKRFA